MTGGPQGGEPSSSATKAPSSTATEQVTPETVLLLKQQLKAATKRAEEVEKQRQEAEKEKQKALDRAQMAIDIGTDSVERLKERKVLQPAPAMKIDDDGELVDMGIPYTSIKNYPGGLEIPQAFVRLASNAHIIGPISCYTPEFITAFNISGEDVYPSMSANEQKSADAAKKALKPYHVLDHFIPLDQLLIALSYIMNLVSELFGNSEAFKDLTFSCFTKLIHDVQVRLVNPNSYPVLRNYVILKMIKLRGHFDSLNPRFPKEAFKWDDNMFLEASATFGHNAQNQAVVFRSSMHGTNKVTWAKLIDLMQSETGRKKVTLAKGEFLDIQREVVEGRELDGRLPTSLGFAQQAQTQGANSSSGYGGGGAAGNSMRGGGAKRTYEAVSGSAESTTNQASSLNTNKTSSSDQQPFRDPCVGCGEEGHSYTVCPKTKLRILNRNLILADADARRRMVVCRSYNIGKCGRTAEHCSSSHSCGKCGRFGHQVTKCTL